MKRIFSLGCSIHLLCVVVCFVCQTGPNCDQSQVKTFSYFDCLFLSSCVREKENEFIRGKHLLPHYGVIQFLKTLISSKASQKIKVIFKYSQEGQCGLHGQNLLTSV